MCTCMEQVDTCTWVQCLSVDVTVGGLNSAVLFKYYFVLRNLETIIFMSEKTMVCALLKIENVLKNKKM